MLAVYFERQFSRHRRSEISVGRMASLESALNNGGHHGGCGQNGDSLKSLPNDINRHPLSCAICRDKYKNPKVLPCLHTFCEACLVSYLPPESLTLTCPECRQQSILPEKGISALQTNFCVTNLAMDKDVGHRCAECGQLAKFKCLDCVIDVCENCKNTHPKTEEGSSHQISQIVQHIQTNGNGELNGSDSNMVVSNKCAKVNGHSDPESRYLYCPSHAGQTLRFFCRDCDTAVCSSCTDILHGRHVTVRVNDAVVEEKVRLKKLMESVQTKVESLQDAIVASEKAMCLLGDRKSESIRAINAVFSELFEKLHNRRHALMEDVDSQFVSKMDQIQKSRNILTTHLQDVKECCQLTQKALGHENETEILFVKKQIGDRLENYANMDPSSALSQVDDSLEFDGHSLERLEVSSMGRVVSNLHKSWAISGDSIESRCVPVGERNILRLHLSSTYAPHLDLRLQDIHVRSSIQECVFALEKPNESDSRSFIIRFLVSRVGPFTLSVMVKGQHISGSPFQFHGFESSSGGSRSNTQSPIPLPHRNGSASTLNSPTTHYCKGSNSKIPTANGAAKSPNSRMSTPTRKFFSNNGLGSIHGLGSGSRRSHALEDDLILKMGNLGRKNGQFANPQDVASTLNGRIVVTDSNNQSIQIFDNTGDCKLRFGTRGRTVGQLLRPVGVAILPATGNIAIADYDNKWISIFDQTGKFMNRIGHGKLLGPKGMTVGYDGLIYVVDNKGSSILVFQTNGKLVRKFGSRGNDEGQFAGPHFIAVNSKGQVIVTDFHNHCVKVFDSQGFYMYSFGIHGSGQGQFNAPTGVAVDKHDNIIVGDWGNSRIQIFDQEGTFISYVSTDTEPLYGPQGLTVTGDGYIAICDSGNHCVKLYKYL